MDSEILPLFSHSGASPNTTTFLPTYFLDENSTTLGLIKALFHQLEEVTGTVGYIDISKLPDFQQELKYLFCGDAQYFNEMDLRNGVSRLNHHFLARDREIQRRGNAFVRVQMAAAEMILYGECRCADPEFVERDQQLVFEDGPDEIVNHTLTTPTPTPTSTLTPPSSPLRNHSNTNESAPPTAMFRSDSIRLDHMKSSPKCIFRLDEQSESMLSTFLQQEFPPDDDFIDPDKLTRTDLERLAELWEYFDCSGERRPLSRDDIADGFVKWGANFIANDSVCQLLGNYYCQKKIKAASVALYTVIARQRLKDTIHTTAPNLRMEPDIPVGATVVYTDSSGASHMATILNRDQSNRYEIEVFGIGPRYAQPASLTVWEEAEDSPRSNFVSTGAPSLINPSTNLEERRERGLSFNVPIQRVRSDSGYGIMDSPAVPYNNRSRSGSVSSPGRRASRSNSMGQYIHPSVPDVGAMESRNHDGTIVTEASNILSQLSRAENADLVMQFRSRKKPTNVSSNIGSVVDDVNVGHPAAFPMMDNYGGMTADALSRVLKPSVHESFLNKYDDNDDLNSVDGVAGNDSDVDHDNDNAVTPTEDYFWDSTLPGNTAVLDTESEMERSEYAALLGRDKRVSGDYVDDDLNDEELLKYMHDHGLLLPCDEDPAANITPEKQDDQTAEELEGTTETEFYHPRAFDTEDIKNLRYKSTQNTNPNPTVFHNPKEDYLDDTVQDNIKMKPVFNVGQPSSKPLLPVPKKYINPDINSGKPMTPSEKRVLTELATRLGPEFTLDDLEDIEPRYTQPHYFLWFRVGYVHASSFRMEYSLIPLELTWFDI
jgi:hypothetical protein